MRRDGGSIVRTARRWRFLDFWEDLLLLVSMSIADDSLGDEERSPTETARAMSATESSSLLGSKIMFVPTAMTSNVIGGLVYPPFTFADPSRGYKKTEASQSSSNMGSSSASDFRRGRRVERRARCVVRLRRGRGYDSAGERSTIWYFDC